MSDHDHIIEPHTRTLHTRREFLAHVHARRGGGLDAAGFSRKRPSSRWMRRRPIPRRNHHRQDGTILVVLQMAGGNDGLNTVVP